MFFNQNARKYHFLIFNFMKFREFLRHSAQGLFIYFLKFYNLENRF